MFGVHGAGRRCSGTQRRQHLTDSNGRVAAQRRSPCRPTVNCRSEPEATAAEFAMLAPAPRGDTLHTCGSTLAPTCTCGVNGIHVTGKSSLCRGDWSRVRRGSLDFGDRRRVERRRAARQRGRLGRATTYPSLGSQRCTRALVRADSRFDPAASGLLKYVTREEHISLSLSW